MLGNSIRRAAEAVLNDGDRFVSSNGVVLHPIPLLEVLDEYDRLVQDRNALLKTLSVCEGAVSRLPEASLGRDPEVGYPYRDELLHNIRGHLIQARGEANDE